MLILITFSVISFTVVFLNISNCECLNLYVIKRKFEHLLIKLYNMPMAYFITLIMAWLITRTARYINFYELNMSLLHISSYGLVCLSSVVPSIYMFKVLHSTLTTFIFSGGNIYYIFIKELLNVNNYKITNHLNIVSNIFICGSLFLWSLSVFGYLFDFSNTYTINSTTTTTIMPYFRSVCMSYEEFSLPQGNFFFIT